MRSPWSHALVAALVLVSANAARADLPHVAHHVAIRARVDLDRHRVTGETTIRFTNTSSAPLTELVFHRYLEAFRDEHSVFMRESEGQLRGVDVRGAGGLELRSIRVDGVERIADVERELVPSDFTQFRLALPASIPIGATVVVRIEFVARLPPLAARAGYVGDFLILGQWFPKLAKLEPDGRFASFPYHGLGEFYSDFADYDVTLDVPSDAVVEGSGVRVAASEGRGIRTVHFVAPAVHDVAYVVARGFRTDETRCGDVRIRTSYPSAFVLAAREHAHATCVGLRFLGERLGPYPYPVLTVIVPPEGADGGAGMEYPTAFVTAGPWYPTRALPYSDAIETTMHELAHQWFQGLVATNEVADPVLDEGLSSFVGYDLLRVSSGRDDVAHFDVWRTYVTRDRMTPAGLAVTDFDDHSYGASVYGRSALVLESIARTYGRDRLYRALGRYARAERFRHPSKDALVRAFDDEFWAGFGRTVLSRTLFEGQRVLLSAERRPGGRLVAVVRGDVPMPVDLLLRGPDGDRRVTIRTGEFAAPAGTRCIALDPDEKLLLDPFRHDDVRCVDRESGPLRSTLVALVASLVSVFGP